MELFRFHNDKRRKLVHPIATARTSPRGDAEGKQMHGGKNKSKLNSLCLHFLYSQDFSLSSQHTLFLIFVFKHGGSTSCFRSQNFLFSFDQMQRQTKPFLFFFISATRSLWQTEGHEGFRGSFSFFLFLQYERSQRLLALREDFKYFLIRNESNW